MMQRLRATKPLHYNTRRLVAGDEFEASDKDARLLIAIRKAEAVRMPTHVPPPPPAVAAKIAEVVAPPDDMGKLRAEYEAVFGKRPFLGWSGAILREKIALARA